MGKSNYARIVSFWKDAQKCEPTFPASLGEWRRLIENPNLDDVTPLADWAGFIAALAKLSWASTVKLAQASSGQISAGLLDGPAKFLALQLWKSSTLVWADTSSAAVLEIHRATDDAEKLIGRLRRASIYHVAFARDLKVSLNKNPPRRIA